MFLDEMEIEVGDTVRIIDEGKLYSTWDEMVKIWRLRWDYNKHRKLLTAGMTGLVIRAGDHRQERGRMILGIGTPEFDFIIGYDGVELLKKAEEQKYVGDATMFDVKNLFLE